VTEYWAGHARGPDFNQLRKLGFTTLYPRMDDYIFLQVTPANKRLLRKQGELGVAFLRKNEQYITVTEDDLERLKQEAVKTIEPGSQVLVTTGIGANMRATVNNTEEGKVHVTLHGYRRTWDAWVEPTEVSDLEDELTALDGSEVPEID
jgi:hypothetical protein